MHTHTCLQTGNPDAPGVCALSGGLARWARQGSGLQPTASGQATSWEEQPCCPDLCQGGPSSPGPPPCLLLPLENSAPGPLGSLSAPSCTEAPATHSSCSSGRVRVEHRGTCLISGMGLFLCACCWHLCGTLQGVGLHFAPAPPACVPAGPHLPEGQDSLPLGQEGQGRRICGCHREWLHCSQSHWLAGRGWCGWVRGTCTAILYFLLK